MIPISMTYSRTQNPFESERRKKVQPWRELPAKRGGRASDGRSAQKVALFMALLLLLLTRIAWADTCTEAEISIGVGSSARPYVFPERNAGIEIDLLRAAFNEVGMAFCPVYAPPSRAARSFAQGRLDGLLNVREARFGGFLSDVLITFHNCAYRLAQQEKALHRISDLAGQSVTTFQRAATLLEPAFAEVVPRLTSYHEVADQTTQLHLLFRGRTDVVVMDRRVFAHYHKELLRHSAANTENGIPTQALRQPVQQHCIFQPSPYSVEFADKAVRDALNVGLTRLRSSGEYERIINRYTR